MVNKLGADTAEDKISNWVALNSLSLNKRKTKTLVFGAAADAYHSKQFVPNNQLVTSAKYLGLEIDHKLSFMEHANKLKKLPRTFRCCINSKSFCLLHCLEHINPLFSQSIITAYGCTVLLKKK